MDTERAINIAKGCVKASAMDSETKQVVIESLNQMFIPKTETTSCEWCEIARACEYNVTFFEDDNRWATERSLLPKYCPNCGRRLEEKNHGSKANY